MKKIIFLSFLLCVLISFGMSADNFIRGTKGLELNDDTYCNDFYLLCTGLTNTIYECSGYEYGCGYDDIIVDGAIHVAGGYAYFGFSAFDPSSFSSYGSIIPQHTYISLSTYTGYGDWTYMYEDGAGGVGSFPGTSPYTLVFGPDPGARSSVQPDRSGK
jgi:hypothetical protein